MLREGNTPTAGRGEKRTPKNEDAGKTRSAQGVPRRLSGQPRQALLLDLLTSILVLYPGEIESVPKGKPPN